MMANLNQFIDPVSFVLVCNKYYHLNVWMNFTIFRGVFALRENSFKMLLFWRVGWCSVRKKIGTTQKLKASSLVKWFFWFLVLAIIVFLRKILQLKPRLFWKIIQKLYVVIQFVERTWEFSIFYSKYYSMRIAWELCRDWYRFLQLYKCILYQTVPSTDSH